MAREYEHEQPHAAPQQPSRRSPARDWENTEQLAEDRLTPAQEVAHLLRGRRVLQGWAARVAARAGASTNAAHDGHAVQPEASAAPTHSASPTPALPPEVAPSLARPAPPEGATSHEHAAPRHERVAPRAAVHPTHSAHAVHHAPQGREAAHETATAAAVHGVDPELLAVVLAGRGTALDPRVQEAVAQHLGADLSAVRVYTGAEADLLSAQAGRMAFTVGESLIFGQGAYRPETPEGQRLLADELAAALGPTPRAVSVTDGGGGGGEGHGEGVGAVRPLAAASPFAGTGATGGHATAAQLLPLIRQVYAPQRRTGAQPHALVGNARAAERPEMVALHDSGAPAVVRVSAGEAARRQTMEGWGTSLSWWAETMGQPGQQHYQQVLDMLFGDGGLRLNIARFNVGGGEHNAHDDPNEKGGHGDPHYQPRLHGNAHAHPGAEMPAFWREVPRGAHVNTYDPLYLGADKDGNHYMFDPRADYYQTKVLADANHLIQHQRGADGALDVRPLYEAFANAAPDWMTRDGAVTGGPTGQDNLDPAHYQDYARYLMDFIVLARREGFAFSSLEAFNEPDAPWWTINGSQEGMHVDPDARAAVLDDLHALAVEYNKGRPPAEQLTLSASDENNVYGTALDLDPSAQAHDWARMPLQPNKLPSIGRLRGYETNAALRAAYERDDIGHLNTHAYAGNFSTYDAGAYGGNEGKAEGVIRGWAGDPRHPRYKVWMSEVGVGDTDKYDPHNAPSTAGVTRGRSNDRNNPQQAAGSVRATDGTNLAQKIIGDLKGLYPSAWIYWQAVEADIDTKDKKGGDHWNSWGLIRLDFKNVNNKSQGQKGNPDFYVAKQYYVMGNFSRFVRPGYTMIDIREPHSVAFVGGKEVVIVTTAAAVDFDLSEFGLAKGTPVQGFVTSQEENLKAHSPAAIIGDKGRLSHQAPGVNATTTYVIPFGAKPANPGSHGPGQGRHGGHAQRYE